jgi:hypothetical protein
MKKQRSTTRPADHHLVSFHPIPFFPSFMFHSFIFNCPIDQLKSDKTQLTIPHAIKKVGLRIPDPFSIGPRSEGILAGVPCIRDAPTFSRFGPYTQYHEIGSLRSKREKLLPHLIIESYPQPIHARFIHINLQPLPATKKLCHKRMQSPFSTSTQQSNLCVEPFPHFSKLRDSFINRSTCLGSSILRFINIPTTFMNLLQTTV